MGKPPRKAASRNEAERKRAVQVKMMASTNAAVPAMAELLGMSVLELRRDYRVELKSGHDFVYAAISQKLVGAAFNGDVRSMLAWMRQFGGWQEISRREITGKNGEPISIKNLDTSSLFAVIEALGQSTIGKGLRQTQIDAKAVDVVSDGED